MSIEKYITEGLILKSYQQGEHDLVFKIFTEKFGVIFVLAKSIRKITSKLRMKMQVGKFVSVTLVHGREVYRLTGVEESAVEAGKHASHLLCESLNRFLPAEKPHKKLFKRLIGITDKKFLESIKINNLRVLIYFMVLVETGYADAKAVGAKDLEEYINFSVQDLYTHMILNEREVKSHLREVLREGML